MWDMKTDSAINLSSHIPLPTSHIILFEPPTVSPGSATLQAGELFNHLRAAIAIAKNAKG